MRMCMYEHQFCWWSYNDQLIRWHSCGMGCFQTHYPHRATLPSCTIWCSVFSRASILCHHLISAMSVSFIKLELFLSSRSVPASPLRDCGKSSSESATPSLYHPWQVASCSQCHPHETAPTGWLTHTDRKVCCCDGLSFDGAELQDLCCLILSSEVSPKRPSPPGSS